MNSQPLSTAKTHSAGSRRRLLIIPRTEKKWFALNAGAMKKTITEWLESIGIKPEQRYY